MANTINKVMYSITLELSDGKNYYCGKEEYGLAGMLFDSFDTDFKYCKIYKTFQEAALECERLKRNSSLYRNAVVERIPYSKK
jgi:hypothetical protein